MTKQILAFLFCFIRELKEGDGKYGGEEEDEGSFKGGAG
jgi:hypothetical protein